MTNTVSGTNGRDNSEATIFLLVIFGYFLVQLLVRLLVGGAYELDEAEMSIMTPDYRLGYGPQLPLYNWLQLTFFHVFGRSLFALALLKNALLLSVYGLLFAGFRLYVSNRVAAFSALSLYLVPYVAFETQRATTHSTILLSCAAATLAAFLWAAKTRRSVAYFCLGLAMLGGGISKYNYWIVPVSLALAALSLADWRAVLANRRILFSLLPLPLLWAPYHWIALNPELAFASAKKLAIGSNSASVLNGFSDLVLALISLGLLPLLIAGFAWWRLKTPRHLGGPVPLSRLLMRASAISLLVMVVGIWVAKVGNVSVHWMLPSAFLFLPALFMSVWGKINRIGDRVFVGTCLVLAVLVVSGLTYDRYKPGARRDVDFSGLPSLVEAITVAHPPVVVAEFFLAGNLTRLRPDWRIAAYLPDTAERLGGSRVIFLFRKRSPAELAQAMASAGWSENADFDAIDTGVFEIPYLHGERTLQIGYAVVDTPKVSAGARSPP